jgi:hypothetical protein
MERLCRFCEEYARSGHNYCRMCGWRVASEQESRPEVNMALKPAEKYCGHCGRQLPQCAGIHRD